MNYLENIILDEAKAHRVKSLTEYFRENPQLVISVLNEHCPNFFSSFIANSSPLNVQKEEHFLIDLIDAGFNYSYTSEKLSIMPDDLLRLSCSYGLLNMTKTLLAKGLNPHSLDDFGMDSFHCACINNQVVIAQYLYQNINVNIDLVNMIGDNVFLSAVRYAEQEMLQFLDGIGVNINYVNLATLSKQENQDALFLAVRDKKEDLIHYLLKHPNYDLSYFEQSLNYAKHNNLSNVILILEDYKNIINEKDTLEEVLFSDTQKKKVKI